MEVKLNSFLPLAIAVNGQPHAPDALHLGKTHQYPLKRRLGGPHIRSACFGEEITLLPLPGIKPHIVKSVA
jgi:hypothetical protein